MKRCKECKYCKMQARANVLYSGIGRAYGRGYFFCEHPETSKLPHGAFGNSAPGFIGFGTTDRESKLTVKTSPRWCPLRKAGKKKAMKRIDKLHEMDARQTAELIFECGIDDQIEFCQGLPECEDGAASSEACKECLAKWLESEVE